MRDRILNGTLWLFIMSLIAAAAIGALSVSYQGVFDLCSHRFASGGLALTLGLVMGAGSFFIVRNANDLMDR